MASEKDRVGVVATLLLEARKKTGLNQSQLAERASVSRSSIIAAESGQSLPTLELCLKLARALGIAVATMFRAHARDYLGGADPSALAELGNEFLGRSHWENVAEGHGLQIEHGRYLGSVNRDGDLTAVRRYTGCFATRPRKRLVFRDRIIGERAPLFAVKGSPKGLGYSMHLSIEGEWAQHIVEFHQPWTAEDGPFDLEFETTLPKAYVLDLEGHNRRRAAEGLPCLPQREARSEYCCFVTYPFATLELRIVFPDSYSPRWCDPIATWSPAPPQDADYDEVHPRTCQSCTFEPGANKAKLVLKRPAPGYLFGVRWQPLDRQLETRGEAK